MPSEMSPKERIIQALLLEEPDRIPVSPHGIDPFNKDSWMYNYPSYMPLLKAVEENCDVMYGHKGSAQRALGIDTGIFLSATNQVEYISEELTEGEITVTKRILETPKGRMTSLVKKRAGFPRREIKGWIETDDDVKKFLSIPYEPPQPDLVHFRESQNRVGDRAAMSLVAPEPIGMVASLFLWENFVRKMYREKDTILELTEIMYERSHNFLRYVLTSGVKAIFWLVGPEYVAPPLFNPRFFEEFAVNFDSKLIELIHDYGSQTIVHCHGSINSILETLASTGTDGLHPVEEPPLGDTPLQEAKKRIGEQVCIVGNIDIGDILQSSPSRISKKVKKAIGTVGSSGLILSTTASPHWWPLPRTAYENYVQLIETAKKFGRGMKRFG